MFHLRLEAKHSKMPLLTKILKFLHIAFLFIINNIKRFYDSQDANICFMTLIQTPMISALNTSGFLLHDSISSTEMVDRLLSMLNQYLISHKTLQLNDTFKVYLKILSAHHSKIKKPKLKPKRKRLKVSKTLGNSTMLFKALWAIDVPQVCDVFKNKCLLIATVLGLAQHDYSCSNKKDKRFVYMQYIMSKNQKFFKYGKEYIMNELDNIFKLNVIKNQDSYELTSTLQILSKELNCQFFIFEGSLKQSHKLYLRYPDSFNPSLKPIFLYKPFSSEHVIYIRNIYRYFHANGSTCLCCKKYFKTTHFCKTYPSCFVCHRFILQKDSYINPYLQRLFCDSLVSNELNLKCQLCNLKILSENCQKYHKRICNSHGFLGYKCDKCNKFYYRSGNVTSQDIKNNHKCGNITCKICFDPAVENHLCKLRPENYPKFFPKLGFLHMEFLESKPLVACAFIETQRCLFKNFIISDPSLQFYSNNEDIYFDYFFNIPISNTEKMMKMFKHSKSNDHKLIKDQVNHKEASFCNQLAKFLFEDIVRGTTFIVSDEDNFTMVIFTL